MGYSSLINSLKNIFTKKAPPKDAMQTFEDMDQFLGGIDAIERQINAYNKAFYEEGSKQFYNIRYPTPDAGGSTSYCYTDGYIVETKHKNIELYPENYQNGLFSVIIEHIDRSKGGVPIFMKRERVPMNLAQLQTYIKNAIKEDRLNLDDIDYTL